MRRSVAILLAFTAGIWGVNLGMALEETLTSPTVEYIITEKIVYVDRFVPEIVYVDRLVYDMPDEVLDSIIDGLEYAIYSHQIYIDSGNLSKGTVEHHNYAIGKYKLAITVLEAMR